MSKINYKGLVIYSYFQKTTRGYSERLCVADPNHNYLYDAIGVTLASGFKTIDVAKAWVDEA